MEQVRRLNPTPKISRPINKKIYGVPTNPVEDLIIEALSRLNYGKGSTRYCVKQYMKTKNHDLKMSEVNLALRNGVESGFLEQPNGPNGLIRIADEGSVGARNKSRKTNRASLERQSTVRAKGPVKPSSHHVTHTLNMRQMMIQGITSVNDGKGTSRERLKEYILGQYFKNKHYNSNEIDSALEDTINKAIDQGILIEPDGQLGVLKVSTLKKIQVGLEKQQIESI